MKLTRTTAVGSALLLTALSTGIAGAQTQEAITVSTEMGEHDRMLEVTDLLGAELEALTLVPGRPAPFRVAVRDTTPNALDDGWALGGYTVDSSMSNLYATSDGSTYDYTDSIPSGDITLGYATSPLQVTDALAKLQPEYLLNSDAPIDCDAINDIIPGLLNILTDPLCGLLSPLTSGLTITDVPLAGSGLTDADLSALVPGSLPLVPRTGNNAGEKYTSPDCANGVGAGAGCGAGRGTELDMLVAGTNTDAGALAALTAALDGALPTTLASATGDEAIASLDDVLLALSEAGGDAAELVEILLEFTPDQQLTLVNELVSATTDPLGIGDILGFGMLAASFPTLQVDPSTGGSGTYSGTLTVRLVDCPAC